MIPLICRLLLFLLCMIVAPCVAQLNFDVIEGTNTFCDTSDTAMTKALSKLTDGQHIPQYCVKVPVGNTGPTPQQMDRCYYLFVPDCAKGPVPIVFNMHGAQSCPIWATYFDRWTETAIEQCFALVYPLGVVDATVADYPCYGIPGGRNVGGLFTTLDCCCRKNGRRVQPSDTQDLAVLRDMIDDVVFEKRVEAVSNGTSSVDATRIYMAGHSNGCIAALGMGAFYSDVVAAVACHAAGGFNNFPQSYSPVPMYLVQGKKDDGIWYQFAEETYRTYGWVHDCKNETVRDVANGTGVEYTNYNCTNEANVTFLLLNESGHLPFLNGFELSEGASRTQIDTTAMAYQFCVNYSKDEIAESLLTRRSSSASRTVTSLSLLSSISFLLLWWSPIW